MGAKDRPYPVIAAMAHRHFPANVFTGDGVTTDFLLPRTILRLGDEQVFVSGLVMRATLIASKPYDYLVRGLSDPTGYPGDSNTVRLTVAPPAAIEVWLFAAGG